jgi:GNAT superfamily N-acetyltransferase
MADRSVRPAAPADAAAVAAVQLLVWRTAYVGIIPAGALEELTEPAAVHRWSEDLAAPPSRQHRVLVAVEEDRVVGLAALAPGDAPPMAEDPAAGELLLLLVDPDSRNRGHGSRLLAAAVDHLRTDGFATAYTWVVAADARSRRFLAAAGWAVDGAARELDMGQPVREVRLHTDLR